MSCFVFFSLVRLWPLLCDSQNHDLFHSRNYSFGFRFFSLWQLLCFETVRRPSESREEMLKIFFRSQRNEIVANVQIKVISFRWCDQISFGYFFSFHQQIQWTVRQRSVITNNSFVNALCEWCQNRKQISQTQTYTQTQTHTEATKTN